MSKPNTQRKVLPVNKIDKLHKWLDSKLHDANDGLNNWKARFEKNAFDALDWGDKVFTYAAEQTIYAAVVEHLEESAQNGIDADSVFESVRDWALTHTTKNALYDAVKSNQGGTSNLAAKAKLAAFAELYNAMEYIGRYND